jgi:hypothetical protein
MMASKLATKIEITYVDGSKLSIDSSAQPKVVFFEIYFVQLG